MQQTQRPYTNHQYLLKKAQKLEIAEPTATDLGIDIASNQFNIPQMLKLKDVIHITCLSQSSIYDIMDKKSPRYDPTFPKQVKLAGRRVAWVADEIRDWLNSKIAQSRKA